jgi:hypothetical protein
MLVQQEHVLGKVKRKEMLMYHVEIPKGFTLA